MDYRKVHSAPKRVITRGPELWDLQAEALRVIEAAVGGTLGPGGQPVLIERPESDLPPVVTKDGVSVFKALGFPDSVMNCIMESTRDVAVRTANEAGDGTTTATILAEALYRLTRDFTSKHRGYSPHRVLRELQAVFRDIVEPTIRGLAIPVSLETTKKGDDTKARKILRQVASLSANGDRELADAVMQCYDICGDEGNVTLAERVGSSTVYEVEEIQGYPIAAGYEEALGPFYTEFLREPAQYKTTMKRPLYLLYHGQLQQWAVLEEALIALGQQPGFWGQNKGETDLVVVACGFSDTVLGQFATNWKQDRAVNGTWLVKAIPLRVPQSGFAGGQKAFLEDLAAVVGAEVYDPVTNPISKVTYEGLGAAGQEEEIEEGMAPALIWRGRTEKMEIGRRWSAVYGYADPTGEEILFRVEELKAALPGAGSKLEVTELTERIARLSGGIARLTIVGTSNGDCKERKDRAEDAVCAAKGALKHGALYGGAWALLQAARKMEEHPNTTEAARAVLVPALRAPFTRLLRNVGIEDQDTINKYRVAVEAEAVKGGPDAVVFDALEMGLVNPTTTGIYDSLPAVLEALRSSLSIGTLHGTMGAVIVYARSHDLEVAEAQAERRTRRSIDDVNKLYTGGSAMLPGQVEGDEE